MTAETADWVGQLIDRRYQVAKKLGEGGMGFVYVATDKRLKTSVVLKVPRFEMLADPEFRQRFVDEVRALVNLSHPHIVKVTDFGTHHSTPFAVMQFLPGGSLEDRRPRDAENRAKAVSAGTLPGWLPAVADALDYIHTQKYIHRDIKPGNILFDAQKHAFISDFGVAKAAGEGKQRSSNLTGIGNIIGTPEYLAPEVVLGEPFDGRIDQYALAVTVYELLTGRVPFQGSAPTATLVMHTRDTATPIDQIRTSVPRALAAAVERAMAKNPAERFPSCTAFAQACIAGLNAAPTGSAQHGVPLHPELTTPTRAGTVRETLGSLQAGLGTPTSTPAATHKPAKSSLGLILGLVGGALGLIGITAAVAVVAMKNGKTAEPPPVTKLVTPPDDTPKPPPPDDKPKGRSDAKRDSTPPVPPPTPRVTGLRVGPASLTLLAGGKSEAIDVTPTRPPGEPVTVTLEAPAGLVVKPAWVTLAGGDRVARFEVSAAAGTPPGSRSLSASAKTAAQATATIQALPVTVRAPSFSVPNLTDRSIQAGGGEDVEVVVNRAGGYDGPVNLTVDSSKVAESASATVAAGQTRGTIKLSVKETAPSGVEVVTIKAEPTDSGVRGTSVGLKVRVVSFRRLHQFAGHDGAVSALAFDPAGRRVLVGTTNGWVYCWDIERPEKWAWADVKHAGRVNAVASSPDGTQAASGGEDNNVVVWKTASGGVEQKLFNNEHTGGVWRVHFAGKGSPLPSIDPKLKQQVTTAPFDLPVSVSPNRTVYWDVPKGKPLLVYWRTELISGARTGFRFLHEGAGMKPEPSAVCDFGNGIALAGLGGDKLEVYHNKQLRATAGGHGTITSFAASGDASRALAACADGQLRLWEVTGRSAKPAPGFPWKPETTAAQVAMTPDGKIMAFGGADGTVSLYKLP